MEKDCEQPWHWRLEVMFNVTEQREAMEKTKVKWSERQNLKRGGREGGRESSHWSSNSIWTGCRARLLLSSRCQRNECWSNWDARLSTSDFLAGWIAWTGLISRISCKKNPNEQAYIDLKNGWDIHRNSNRRSRRENSGLGQVDEDKRAVRENRAVYRQEEMNVEWRGLSASSLCNVAVEIIVTDAFTKSQVGSGSHKEFSREWQHRQGGAGIWRVSSIYM